MYIQSGNANIKTFKDIFKDKIFNFILVNINIINVI